MVSPWQCPCQNAMFGGEKEAGKVLVGHCGGGTSLALPMQKYKNTMFEVEIEAGKVFVGHCGGGTSHYSVSLSAYGCFPRFS